MNAKTIQVKQADDILKSLEDAFKGLPKLPKGLVDFFVAIAPWISLVGGVLLLIIVGILGLISLIGSVMAAVVALAPQYVIMMLITLAIAIIEGVLMLLAFSPLKARMLSGWRMMAYVEFLSVISTILTLNIGGIVWGLIWNAIGFYILFQMRPHYK